MAKTYYLPGKPLPKSLGRCVDELHKVRTLRIAMEKETKEVKKRENELSDRLLDKLSASDETGVAGKKYRAQVKREEKATVDDWEKVYNYVVEEDAFDIMGKSVNQKAITERFENGDAIPGISKIQVKKLSITKLS